MLDNPRTADAFLRARGELAAPVSIDHNAHTKKRNEFDMCTADCSE